MLIPITLRIKSFAVIVFVLSLFSFPNIAQADTFSIGNDVYLTINLNKSSYTTGEQIYASGYAQSYSAAADTAYAQTETTGVSPVQFLYASITNGAQVYGYAEFPAPTTPGSYNTYVVGGTNSIPQPTLQNLWCSTYPLTGGTMDDYHGCYGYLASPAPRDSVVNIAIFANNSYGGGTYQSGSADLTFITGEQYAFTGDMSGGYPDYYTACASGSDGVTIPSWASC